MISDLLLVEISQHGAQMCSHARKQGLGILPFGSRSSHGRGVHSCPLDLSSSDHVGELLSFLQQVGRRIVCIWISPDASTTSRARDRRLQTLSSGGPKQLRSHAHPMGIPGLGFGLKRRTELANQALDSVARIARWASDAGIPCFVCNPQSSHMWSTPMLRGVSDCLTHSFAFHECMHGGCLPKLSRVQGTHDFLQSLHLLCDHHHFHSAWQPKVADGCILKRTRHDVELPHLFVERAVSCIIAYAHEQGASAPLHLREQLLAPCPAASRLVLGAFPRSHALRPLVPEFGRYVKVLCRPSSAALMTFMRTLPKGAKITARFLNGAPGSGGQHACAPYLDHVDLTRSQEQQSFSIEDVALGAYEDVHGASETSLHKGCKAECISERLLRRGFVTKCELSDLLDALPSDKKFASNRGQCVDTTKTWTTGAYRFSEAIGLRTNTHAYPRTTRLLSSLVTAVFPGCAFSSVGLFKNLKTAPHRDVNNSQGVPNLLVPCSDFTNGSVKVYDSGDSEEPTFLDVSKRPAKLDASKVHSTEDWKGDRLLLVAFHVQGAGSLRGMDARTCGRLGLQLEVTSQTRSSAGCDSEAGSSVETVLIGVPHGPEEFVRKAVAAGHPMDMDRLISPAVDAAVKANFCDDASVVSRRRSDTLRRWSARARELDGSEARANARRPAHLRKLLAGKRILLWKEILAEIGYPDTAILDEVESGLPLTGWMAQSQVFQQRARPPTMSVSTVLAMNKGFHALVRRRLAKRQDPEVEEKTWRETEEELAKGWFWIDHSGSWEGKIIAHRFGLLQKLKLRTIDDCSVGGLNCTVGLPDKMRVHSIDVLSSMLRRALELCGGRASCRWVGRTYDLQAAYRQFGIDVFTRELLRIAVNRPGSDEPVLLGANSLPFGAVGSVSGFLRLSMALWATGLIGLQLCWSAFYDDYPTVTSEPLRASTESTVHGLFTLLGMDYATEGKKAPPFSEMFAALGVNVDMTGAARGSVVVGHTSARKEELSEVVDGFLQCGSMTAKDAERLRGRLVFFEGFTFGRVAQVAMKHIGRHALGSDGSVKLSADVTWALRMVKLRIKQALPITISSVSLRTSYIFTDGAFEKGRGTFGGVFVDHTGACLSYFAGEINKQAMSSMLKTSVHPIYELELLPVLIAMQVWGNLCAFQQVVYYLDNEPARIGMIKGSGGTPTADRIITKAAIRECELGQHAWYARVASHANIADDPSRFSFDRLHRLGAARVMLNDDWVASLVLEAG